MAVINIDDAYILGETGAQVDKVTGLFTKDEETTEEEKAFAQLNIGASGGGGGGGRNFIDNAWFTINQRGATGASSNTYGLDRWLGVGTGYTVNSDGTVTITGAMVQRNDWAFLWDKTVTISAMVASGEIYSWSGTLATGAKSIGGLFNAVVVSSSQINFSAVSNLKALKLELGSVSTLANDAPPDYGEELRKCMRYFVRLQGLYAFVGSGWCLNATSAMISAPLPVPMRAIPTVSFTGLYLAASSYFAVSALTVLGNYAMTASNLSLRATASGLTTDTPCIAQFRDSGAYIDLSADL